MAVPCKEQQERIEKEVLQPMEKWVQNQSERCSNKPCNWWMLCLNKLICAVVWLLVKICVWILVIMVRWGYRIVCTVVSLVIGIVLLAFDRGDALLQALRDTWELIKDIFYAALGYIIMLALALVDAIQTTIGVQDSARPLFDTEHEVLWPIFRRSLPYGQIRVVTGRLGLFGVGRGAAFTMGLKIYFKTYSLQTLVHECVHVWQFLYQGGTKYIGQSALTQLDSIAISPAYDPYDWANVLSPNGPVRSWYQLPNVEAQAAFVDAVYGGDKEVLIGGAKVDVPAGILLGHLGDPKDSKDGAFFRLREGMSNSFTVNGVNYTDIANEAWRVLRTGP